MRTASAWPVPPEETCSYEGSCWGPPVYPEVTESTPGTFSNGGAMHQKHPPAKVAMAAPGGTVGIAALGFPLPAGPVAEPLPTTSATPTATARAVMIPRRILMQILPRLERWRWPSSSRRLVL